VTYLASKAIEFDEKRKIRAIMPFKSFNVIEVGNHKNKKVNILDTCRYLQCMPNFEIIGQCAAKLLMTE